MSHSVAGPLVAGSEDPVVSEQPKLEPSAGHEVVTAGIVNPVFVMTPPHPLYGLYHRDHNAWENYTRGQDRNPRVAMREWVQVASLIERLGGHVVVLVPHIYSDLGLSDAVFAANHGYLFRSDEGTPLILGARMLHPIRQGEIHLLQQFWHETVGLRLEQPGTIWEGQADVSRLLPDGSVILTHGVRTTLESNQAIRRYFRSGTSFLDIRMREPFFHGDTCINVIRNQAGEYFVIYCPEALADGQEAALLRHINGKATPIPISRRDAEVAYVANSLEIGGTLLLLSTASEELKRQLKAHGFDFQLLELSELFVKGGGGTRCCVMEMRGLEQFPDLASLLLSNFRFREADWLRLIPSYVRSARSQATSIDYDLRAPALRALNKGEGLPDGFEAFREAGESGTVTWQKVPTDQGLSPNFYVTSGDEVAIWLDGKWTKIEWMRPGAVIAKHGGHVEAKTLAELSSGDEILETTEVGILRAHFGAPMSGGGDDTIAFGFHGTGVTHERSQEAQILQVAQVIWQKKLAGEKIVLVAGPAIAHSDASKYLAALIKAGWVDVLYTGNAYPTHDLELAHLGLGTSLGSSPELDRKTGSRAVPEGEKHHLLLLNEARAAGSLEALIRSGRIGERSAIRAAIENGIDLIMAGSIRDDGPLPGVISDTHGANDRLRAALQDAGVVIGVATYLHTAAALNQVPATTPKVLVDVNQGVLSRLIELNPHNVSPILSNSISFLEKMCRVLGVAVDHLAIPSSMGMLSQETLARRADPETDADVSAGAIQTARVFQNGVAPDGYLSTTNEITVLTLAHGQDITVSGQKMDGVFVVDHGRGTATVKVFRQLVVGDEVVVGPSGVTRFPLTNRDTPQTVQEVAERLFELKRAGKPVLLVSGDALISSGAGPFVAELVRRGYINRLHSGIALPLFEGIALRGDDHPLRTLEWLRSTGGLEAFAGLDPEKSIFHAAHASGAEVVLTASPNDTGFFPGVISDTAQAQDAIRKAAKDCGLLLYVGSVLHSIATGNLASGDIPVVAVDINRFSIGKLADRGTVQAKGFEMDVRAFFLAVLEELGRLERRTMQVVDDRDLALVEDRAADLAAPAVLVPGGSGEVRGRNSNDPRAHASFALEGSAIRIEDHGVDDGVSQSRRLTILDRPPEVEVVGATSMTEGRHHRAGWTAANVGREPVARVPLGLKIIR